MVIVYKSNAEEWRNVLIKSEYSKMSESVPIVFFPLPRKVDIFRRISYFLLQKNPIISIPESSFFVP